jgi:alpha/beta superfamily hydrolase
MGIIAAIDLQGPVGRLEALHEEPSTPPRFAALVCHPHPLHGGTMQTHAVHRMARAARAAGGATLRFNFRGVGRSAGKHDGGPGEVEDAAAALSLLASRYPSLPLLACGFSFGAHVALAAGPRAPGVTGLLLAGLVVRPQDDVPRDLSPLRDWPGPAAVIQAAGDQFGSPAEVRAALAGAAGPRRLVEVPRATHLFTEDLAGLEHETKTACGWLLGGGR